MLVPTLAGAWSAKRFGEASVGRRVLALALIRVLVQIQGIEIADLAEAVPIENRQRSIRQLDEPVPAQRLECAVSVNGREPRRVRELLLGDRKMV